MIGRRLAHYEITEKLGEGGMGEVYLARDTHLERHIALKVLPAEVASDPGRLARFEREARAVAALNHPSIVHIYSVEVSDEIRFFTMEWVDGETLREVIPTDGLVASRFFDLAIRLADALASAHEHGVIHRDLKPSNIMIDCHGRPKILDFGLAKLRAPQVTIDSQMTTEVREPEDLTREGAILGTYRYMSPEQIDGRGVDHRSDLFSLGIVFYEMACGHTPFEGSSPVRLMGAILEESPRPIRRMGSALPDGLQEVVDACLEKDVDSRIQSAAELRDRLAALAPGAARQPLATTAKQSDIFISYAREDRPAAKALAEHLERHGWSVWWDREIAAGEAFDEVIEEAMRTTRCVAVLWSRYSVGSRWVRAEAEEGAKRDILVPVLLDQVDVPLAFRQIQAADLTAWNSSAESLTGEELIRDVCRVLEPTGRQSSLAGRGTADRPPSDQRASPPVPGQRTANFIRKPLVGMLGLLIVVALALAFFGEGLWREAENSVVTAPRITSLAVLPLENLSGNPAQDFYASGLTEGLIADLGRISALRVISRQSVMRFEGSDESLPEIAEALGVEALIEGSVLSVGDRVRVTAQLVQAKPEQHLWARTYERDAEDVLALLGEVTRAISAEVRVAISPDEAALLANARQVNPDAHRAFLRGAQAIRRLTPEDVGKAAEFFREAIALDPDYADPWAGLASYHLALEFYGLPIGAEDQRRESSRGADVALARALELDNSLSQIYQLQGSIDFWRNWSWDKSEAGFRRSIELNPNDSNLRIYYALYLAAMGRHDEAAQEADAAEELDPLSQLVHRFRGDIEYYAGNFESAVRRYERSLELDPGNLYVTGQMGFSLFALGRSDEAAEAWQTSRRLFGQEALARTMQDRPFEETARLWLEAAKDPAFSGISGPSVIAVVHAMLGEYEEALDWLDAGYATRGDPGKSAGWMLPFVKQDPFLAPLHEEPRFQNLLRRLGLAD